MGRGYIQTGAANVARYIFICVGGYKDIDRRSDRSEVCVGSYGDRRSDRSEICVGSYRDKRSKRSERSEICGGVIEISVANVATVATVARYVWGSNRDKRSERSDRSEI